MIRVTDFVGNSGSWGVHEEPSGRSVTFTHAELVQLTGYQQPKRQLEVLHRRGFTRAYLGRRGVVLEHAHYLAVCARQVEPSKPTVRPIVRGVRASKHGTRTR